jgi:hypothetical protein
MLIFNPKQVFCKRTDPKQTNPALKSIAFTLAILAFGQSPLFGKEKLRALVFGLANDTLQGEIKVKNAFDNSKNALEYLKNYAYSYLQFSIEFTSVDGKDNEFKPGQIQGFLIWTSDSTYEKYVSVDLSADSRAEDSERKFRRPGMAARFDLGENKAFVRVLHEQGYAKLYVFYEEDIQEFAGGGPAPVLTNSLNERFLIRKGNDAYIKLNHKNKRQRAQLIQLFGDCEKIKTFLEKPKRDTADLKTLTAIVTSYNNSCPK